ncbi:desmocollin-1 [Ornithorhynchus anatinus]|uniref:desmocollin-1 n=1 Tax=Ornithorhynchus anatinus TaxID=9258 RepID=UPI0019D426BC|nr:desmocollin-1 [Ornithorhynchus anatinus]
MSTDFNSPHSPPGLTHARRERGGGSWGPQEPVAVSPHSLLLQPLLIQPRPPVPDGSSRRRLGQEHPLPSIPLLRPGEYLLALTAASRTPNLGRGKVLSSFCEACKKVVLKVPSHLQAGTLVGKVDLDECLTSANIILSNDPDFRVLEDGSVYATNTIRLSSEQKAFTILLSDTQKSEQKELEILLLPQGEKTRIKRQAKNTVLKRTKRKWAPIPCSLMENSLGPFPQQIQQIQSDAAQNYTIYYSIGGPGVDKEPFNLFYIERDTGDIYCTRSVDREQYESFQIIGYATTPDGYTPEHPLPLLIKVEDDNDNAPYFENQVNSYSVMENCRVGMTVGQVTAKDKDEPHTLHTRLKYTILKQIPDTHRAFTIHPESGVITTTTNLLDREECHTYQLIVQAQDMGGQPFGLRGTGTVTITLEDENDNSPVFTQASYIAQVEENTVNVEILRLRVEDKDIPNSPHSRANYTILKGNENGNFRITTDPRTNEGVLCVVKALNYEEIRQMLLVIGVVNEARFSKGGNSRGVTMCTTEVTVNVRDQDEGPECNPPIKVIQSKDGLKVGSEIFGYQAVDPETGNSEGLRYQKLSDKDNWFEINESTGTLRTVKELDRESKFVKNNQYNVTVSARDAVGRTCTGTLVVLMEDINDNAPRIIQNDVIICHPANDFVELKAVDFDEPENGPPFSFALDNSAIKFWTIEKKTDTTAQLHLRETLKYDNYSVPIMVTDRHGHGKMTPLKVRVCQCTVPSECPRGVQKGSSSSDIRLGRWAILAIVLGSALLLCVLLTCVCATAKRTVQKCFPEDIAQQNLIISNTEGPGEEVMDANIRLPNQSISICDPVCVGTLGGQGIKTGGHQNFEMVKGGGHHTLESCKGGGQSMMDTGRYAYTDWHCFTQPRLGEKVYLCGQDEEHKHSEDYVLSYNYEGKGSAAGSVGCCSDQQEEEGLEFLVHLEPKFKTLAKTCLKQ